MKKIIYFIFLLLAVSFASCTEEEDMVEMTKSNKISFFVDGNSNYKGTILTGINLSKFNVYAYSSTNLMSPTISLSPYINNLIVTKTSGLWNYTGCYYWPEDGFIHFFAVASDENNVSLPTGVSNWTIGSTGYPSFSYQTKTDTSQKDLVVAKSIDKTMSNSPSGVTMNFQHILTKINISYKKSNNTQATMKKIEILNAETTGVFTFNSSNGAWSNLDSTKTLTYWTGTKSFNKTIVNLDLNLFIIPQSNILIKFYYNTNSTKTVSISPTTIGGNVRYTVTI